MVENCVTLMISGIGMYFIIIIIFKKEVNWLGLVCSEVKYLALSLHLSQLANMLRRTIKTSVTACAGALCSVM